MTGSLPLVRDDHGVLDVARTVEAVPRLAKAGVTDFRVAMPTSKTSSTTLRPR